MSALPEELDFELEALRATYGEDSVCVADGDGAAGLCSVVVPVAPRTAGGGEHECFVAGRLVMAVCSDYPVQAPRVQLTEAKGLGDARLAALQSSLAGEAASLAGELQLGHLVETALDLLTAANQPEGDCVFCLEPLLEGGDASSAQDGAAAVDGSSLCRLGCYHCFHMSCFAPWWQWQQRRTAEREQQLRQEYKSMAPLKLEEEGIRKEDAGSSSSKSNGDAAGRGSDCGAYVLACPACRAAVLPSSLAHAWTQLQAATAESWSQGASRRKSSSRATLQELPPQQRQQLAAMQQRHAAVMQRQQACGGLVDATHSVSISDLQLAAAAAATAEAPAEEPAPVRAAAARQRGSTAGAGRGRGKGRGGRGQQQHGGATSSGEQSGGQGGRQGAGRGGGRHVGGRAGGPQPAGHTAIPAAGTTAAAAAQGAMAGLCLEHPPRQQQQAQRTASGRGSMHRGSGRGGGRGRSNAAAAGPPPANT